MPERRPGDGGLAAAPAAAPKRPAGDIEAWLREGLASQLGVDASEIDPARPTEEYGLGSAQLVILSGELQDWLGREVEPTVFWDHETLAAVAASLAADE